MAGPYGHSGATHPPLGYTKNGPNTYVPISNEEDKKIWKKSVHTQHKDYDMEDLMPKVSVPTQYTKTQRKKVLIPVEETREVPVYRQTVKPATKTVYVKGKRLVPVTRYKEVEETRLEVVEEMIGGHKEKRAKPITKLRQIPYTHYEEQIVEVPVQVPDDELNTKLGHRVDKHIVSKVVEVEEDHIYEMRPVLVSKGDKRMKETGEHHQYKTSHGKANWDTQEEGWHRRPKTPLYHTELPRPQTASSIRSAASSMVLPRLRAGVYHTGKVPNKGEISPKSQYGSPKKSHSTPNL